jgi:hypothetical protein
MVAPPLAFILSLIGLIRRQDRSAAIVGMIVSGACAVWFFGMPLVLTLCQ